MWLFNQSSSTCLQCCPSNLCCLSLLLFGNPHSVFLLSHFLLLWLLFIPQLFRWLHLIASCAFLYGMCSTAVSMMFDCISCHSSLGIFSALPSSSNLFFISTAYVEGILVKSNLFCGAVILMLHNLTLIFTTIIHDLNHNWHSDMSWPQGLNWIIYYGFMGYSWSDYDTIYLVRSRHISDASFVWTKHSWFKIDFHHKIEANNHLHYSFPQVQNWHWWLFLLGCQLLHWNSSVCKWGGGCLLQFFSILA